MKFLIICDSFYPEKKSISRHINDLINHLSENLIEVHIIFPSKEKREFFTKKFQNQNLKFYPIQSRDIKNKSFILRGLGEFLLPFNIWRKLKYLNVTFDKILVFSPSIFFSLIFKKIKKKFNSKIILIVRDIFPDWMMQKNKLLHFNPFYLFAKIVAHIQFLKSDIIACQTKNDQMILSSKYNNKKVITLYNWISLKKKNSKLYKNKITNFVFLGTIGPAQDWNKITMMVNQLNKEKFNFNFFFIGNGMYKNFLTKKFKRFKNIKFIDSLVEEEMYKKLLEMDVGIISLHKKIKYNNIPGKFFSYLECNLPILCDSDSSQEISKIIKKFKLGKVNSSDSNLIDNAIHFIKNEINYKILKENYNKCYNSNFSTKKAVKIITSL